MAAAEELPPPAPWEQRPISFARWKKNREAMMSREPAGHRPDEWWFYERRMPPPDDQTATLYDIGELTSAELEELTAHWRSLYTAIHRPHFAYCTGQVPGKTEAAWIYGEQAREAYLKWTGIPDHIVALLDAEWAHASWPVDQVA